MNARDSEGEGDVYDDGLLRIEHDNYYVGCAGKHVRLTLKQFKLISLLARKADRIVRSQDLWRFAWGESKPLDCGILRVHISRIRRKLAPFGVRVESMVNVGYRLSKAETSKTGTSEER